MKFLIVLASLLLGASAMPGNTAAVEKAALKCRENTAITQETIENLFNGKTMGEPDYDTKCYFKCLLDNVGLTKADGTYEMDAEHARFNDCAQKQMMESDLCQRAYHFHQCIHTQFPDLPIF